MALLYVVRLVKDNQVNLAYRDETISEQVEQDLRGAHEGHVLRKLLILILLCSDDASHFPVELADWELEVTCQNGVLLEAQGNLFHEEKAILMLVSVGTILQFLLENMSHEKSSDQRFARTCIQAIMSAAITKGESARNERAHLYQELQWCSPVLPARTIPLGTREGLR